MNTSTNPIFETKCFVNNSETYTGRFICYVDSGVAFHLPGRGGLVSKKAANRILSLWKSGKTVGEITKETGCDFI